MRYFVYRDSRIVGPFAPEELHQAGDLSHETLVCEESATGGRDADWRPLREVAELSQVRMLEPAFFDEAPPGLGPGGLERLELDALGVPEDDDQGAAWIRSLFEDADFRNRFSGLLPKSDDDPQQLSLAKSRIAQLSGELEALRARLSELENARHAQWKTVELPKILESAMGLPPVAAEPPKTFSEPPVLPAAAPLPQTPLPSAGTAKSPPAPAQPQASAAQAPVEPLRPGLRIASSSPLSGTPLPEAPASEPASVPARGLRLKIASSASLPVAEPPAMEPAPAAEVAGPVFDWQEPETPQAQPQVLPEAKALPAGPIAPVPEETLLPPSVRPIELQPPPAEPAAAASAAELAPAEAAAPAGLEAAPISLQAAPISLEASALQPPAETSSLQAVPLPAFGAAPPLTAVFGPGETAGAPISGAGFPSAPVDLGGMPADLAAAAPAAGISDASVADVVARLARPAPTQIPAPKPPRRGVSRLALAALFGLTAAVAGAFFLFLRNPRDLKTMVAMGSDQKPLGAEAPDESAFKPATPNPPSVGQPLPLPTAAVPGASGLPGAVSSPASVAPQAAAPAPAATPVQPAAGAAPQQAQSVPAPAEAAPAAPEGGDAAIALVKEFPLDGDRGTVGQWLQYSFAANPGDGNKEQWTSAAGDDPSTFIVQYQVQPGPSAGSAQAINYVFEADLQRKIVRGNSDNARQLLAGGEPAPAKRPKAIARKRKRPAARRPKPAARTPQDADKPLSLLPLPTDAELVPPAEDDSSFQDPTVLQQPGQ